MNIVLLSGGSGKRLWPLSNEIRSKQFLKVFRKENGEYESMVQRVYRQIRNVDSNANVTIATSKSQVSSIRNQLGKDVGISVEPCRRDTFPAIVLAAAYLRDVKGVSEDEALVVCPVDPYVEDDFFFELAELGRLAQDSEENLVLMGIKPTYPSEKYGYIIPESEDSISKVLMFKEKPDMQMAKLYMSQGALWNGGVFAFKIGYILKIAHQILAFSDYNELYSNYEKQDKISFDYAVVEKEQSIKVMRFMGQWKDLGTWNTLVEAMSECTVGKAKMDSTCKNVHVINEMDVPILCMGLHDIVVAASPEGILVSDKRESSFIKPFIDQIDQQVMFAEKSWGSYRVLDVEKGALTIKVTLKSGCSMNYHSHQFRDEIWNVISGEGNVIIDDKKHPIKPGDSILIPAGCYHKVIAISELKMIELQLGNEISVHDKQKLER